jgi:hypothetical protein
VWARTLRAAALAMLGAGVVGAAGCGSGYHATSEGLRLQREDLIATANALSRAQHEVEVEARDTKRAWPLVANGLPRTLGAAASATIATAARQAATVTLPGIFQEARAQALTGPASSLVGDFRQFAALAMRGWQMIEYAVAQQEAGPGATAAFARANVDLYIESVYDGHFGLAQVGKKLIAAYSKLGGASAFGSSLTQADVDGLASSYSEAQLRLHPHDGVKYGS